MKSAKEYYSDTMEGVRITACGLAMLAVCAGRFVISKIGRRSKNGAEGAGKPATKEDGGGSEVEDAVVVGNEEG